MHRSYTRESTKEVMDRNAQYNEKGQMLDPNTHEPIQDGKVIGHPTGLEWHGFESYGDKSGMCQSEMNDIQNNGCMLQWESNASNGEHTFEEKDANVTALNTANYCYLEAPQYQATTYINPPNAEGEPWTLTTENTQTGVESQVGTFNPDLGEVTPESQTAIHSAVSSYNSEPSVSYENDMSDFGSGTGNDGAIGDSESAVDEVEDGSTNCDDGMTI